MADGVWCVRVSSQLLVTGPTAAAAAELACSARANLRVRPGRSSDESLGLPLGLHFNLTEGVCLYDGSTMLGKEGFWQATREGDPKIDAEYVRQELMAQVSRFKDLVGATPIYVDGHNHIHVIPVVAGVLAELLPKYRIRFIRCPMESLPIPIPTASDAGAAAHPVLPSGQRAFFDEIVGHAATARALWARHGLHSSSDFIGLQLMGHHNTRDRLHRTLRGLQAGVTEYMCHPGHASTIGDAFSQSRERDHELEMLCDQEMQQLLVDEQIHLASWNEAIASS